MAPMFRALLLCADGDCAEAFEAYGSLEELETLGCDCGCTLELLEISDTTEPATSHAFDLIPLR